MLSTDLTRDECLLVIVLATKAFTELTGDPAMVAPRMELESIIQKMMVQATTGEAAYVNPDWPPRACDHCGKEYHGPAVFCSLTCALAEA